MAKQSIPDQQETVADYTIVRLGPTVSVYQGRKNPLTKVYGNDHAGKCAFGRLVKDENFIRTWCANVKIDMIKAGLL